MFTIMYKDTPFDDEVVIEIAVDNFIGLTSIANMLEKNKKVFTVMTLGNYCSQWWLDGMEKEDEPRYKYWSRNRKEIIGHL